MMANDAVRVELPERACGVALGHFRLDGSPLQPESRAAILRRAESAHGHVQTVTCTRAEADAGSAHWLYRRGTPRQPGSARLCPGCLAVRPAEPGR